MAEDRIAPLPDPGAQRKASNPWIPLLALIVLMPALAYAMVEFLVIPRMRAAFHQDGAGLALDSPGGSGHRSGAKGELATVAFNNIIANLSGSLRSRYVKVSFVLKGSGTHFPEIIESRRVELVDASIGVLSALSVQDLEEPAVKNLLRNNLVAAFESILGEPAIEALYFSELVIQ